MSTETLPTPFTSALLADRWVLIDETCQIMFVGEGTDRLVFVFPTSTGEPGHETRDQDLQPVRRFNPALIRQVPARATLYLPVYVAAFGENVTFWHRPAPGSSSGCRRASALRPRRTRR